VIKSFRDRRTAAIFLGAVAKGLHPALARRARTKLILIDRARDLADLRVPPGNRLERLRVIGKSSTRFASTTSGASASPGRMAARSTWNFAIIIEVHP